MNTNRLQGVRLPAEWEQQRAIMLIWPHEDTDWCPYLEEITEVYLQMAKAITRHEKLLITARNTERVQDLLTKHLTEGQMKQVTIFACDNNDTWARDVAPITLLPDTTASGTEQTSVLLDFCFNGWGEKFAADKDNKINQAVYKAGLFEGTLVSHKDFILEGGSIECDGKHTLFTTTGCLMAPHRNQPLSKEDIDQKLRSFFPNINHIVWLDYGQLAGDDTDGHIDTIVRIAPNDTLLYIRCDDPQDEHYDERLPATHANFLILNDAVLVPTYDQPEKDKRAMEQIQLAFPDREIIGIDSRTIIRQHGSIHCLTMQLPLSPAL